MIRDRLYLALSIVWLAVLSAGFFYVLIA